MPTKQFAGTLQAPDGSYYVTATDGAGNLVGAGTADIPAGATFVSNSVQGTTNATAATLPATAGKTTYIKGFAIRGNATAAATGFATIGGILGGSLSFNHFTAPLASGMGTINQDFSIGLPANAPNTTIVVTAPAAGAGGTVSVCAWGYQL